MFVATLLLLLLQPKGSSFEGNDKDFYRFVLGDHTVIPAFEEAVATMKVRACDARPRPHYITCITAQQLCCQCRSVH
jgi:hypothetical protein